MGDIAGQPIEDARAWRGEQLTAESDWVTQLSAVQVQALYDLATTLPSDSVDWLDLNLDQIVPSVLRDLFASASAQLANGMGFVLLRGLDAGDVERLRRVFWIIGNHLGEPVMQNARGEILSVIADRFAGAQRGVDTRGYESNDELRFHCDGGDCIGMTCVRQANKGGSNGLVSMFAIYNEILAHHPQYLDVLMQGYPLYSRKEKGDAQSTKDLGKVQQKRIPMFAWHESRMSTWLNIQLAELAAQVSGADFTDAEAQALACVEEIAGRDELQLSFKQQPGDVLFVNNLALMHRRDKYFDPADENQKRMLYRMWINLHESHEVVRQHAALRKGIRGPSPVIAA